MMLDGKIYSVRNKFSVRKKYFMLKTEMVITLTSITWRENDLRRPKATALHSIDQADETICEIGHNGGC